MNTSTDLFAIPGAVKRLGEELFLKIPLYAAGPPYKAIYINPHLFSIFFGDSASSDSWESMEAVISRHFSVTLTPGEGQKQVGWAYIDRQHDPLQISLAGNLGSGRAYYTGGCFNIKGEKTPLAVSAKPLFSDGFLEMERGIWETIIANAVEHDLDVGAPPVLAILDIDEMCTVPWREQPVKRVKIIRIDNAGALDRITHLFYNKTPLGTHAMMDMARMFGIQSAEKYIERIIHGAWSPGNISPKGHLIDFDTVCAVKGRAPVYSSSMWHFENYFGLEHHGQQNILKALAEDPVINNAAVNYSRLREHLIVTMKEQIARKLLYLMGFTDTAAAWAVCMEEMLLLADTFTGLAQKFYGKFDALSVKNALCNVIHAVDFSYFFRYYPLLKRTSTFSSGHMVRQMMHSGLLDEPFVPTSVGVCEEDNRFLGEKVYCHLTEHIVATPSQATEIARQTIDFIGLYEALFSKIAGITGADMHAVEARAYAINEDRFYLFPVHTPTYALSCSNYTPAELHRYISLFIRANIRKPGHEHVITDMRIYAEGYFYLKMNGSAHRKCFCFFRNRVSFDKVKAADFQFNVRKASVDFSMHLTDSTIDLIGEEEDNFRLLAAAHRENTLISEDLLILYNGNTITLNAV